MKTIIAGSREITRLSVVIDAIHKCGFDNEITQVVCGGARGVDLNGAWAALHVHGLLPKLDSMASVIYMMADWTKHGKAAGPMRNLEMAEYADALILIWDGKSRGSQNMLDIATALGLRIYVHRVT